MDPITLIIILLGVTIGGLLIGLGVHFVPVGGAPAAMAQATGIGTGTTMLAFSSGALGLISAGFTLNDISRGSLKTQYPGFGRRWPMALCCRPRASHLTWQPSFLC